MCVDLSEVKSAWYSEIMTNLLPARLKQSRGRLVLSFDIEISTKILTITTLRCWDLENRWHSPSRFNLFVFRKKRSILRVNKGQSLVGEELLRVDHCREFCSKWTFLCWREKSTNFNFSDCWLELWKIFSDSTNVETWNIVRPELRPTWYGVYCLFNL